MSEPTARRVIVTGATGGIGSAFVRLEEAVHGVRVTSIYPGGIATELLRKVRGALGRPYDPAACVSPDSLAALVGMVLGGAR
jgi:NAD(P)-dependent dehydrogenase (short-subunit alcohol dehydrogenase family)